MGGRHWGLHWTCALAVRRLSWPPLPPCEPFLPGPLFSSVAQSCPTLCDPVDCSTPGLPVHRHLRSLLKLMPIESVMPSSRLILWSLDPPIDSVSNWCSLNNQDTITPLSQNKPERVLSAAKNPVTGGLQIANPGLRDRVAEP